MKQFAFMIAVTLVGAGGALVYSPYLGVLVYWFYAVLRPQYMWQWALVVYPMLEWSRIVAIATMVAAAVHFLSAGATSAPGQGRSRFSFAHWLVIYFGILIIFTHYVTSLEHNWLNERIFLDYMKFFIMFGVSTILVHTIRQIWILYVMVAVVLGYIAYEVNIEYVLKGYLGIYHNGYGGMDNNGAGLMLAMGVPLCYFTWLGVRKWWRWGFAICIPGIVHSVLMTYSRGAMVSLVIVVPLLFLRSPRKTWFVAAAIVMAFLLPIMAGPQIRKRFFSIEQHEVDATANSRRQAWTAAWEIIRENPWFGIGIRNSGPKVAEYTGGNTAVHNQYLQLGADCGLVGLTAYLAMLGGAWFGLRRVRRYLAGRDDDEALRIRTMASGLECALLIFCVAALFLSVEVFELPYFLMFLAMQLATLARDQQLAKQQQEEMSWLSARMATPFAWPPQQYAVR